MAQKSGETKRLVVEIPETEYDMYRQLWDCGMGSTAIRRILDGKPLPKGHGRLIDADAILAEPFGDTYADIAIAETIVEADKEGED